MVVVALLVTGCDRSELRAAETRERLRMQQQPEPWQSTNSGPPGANQPPRTETTVDGRIIEYTARAPWCYQDTEAMWGGRCNDTESECIKEVDEVRKSTMFDFAKRIEGEVPDKDARFEAAAKYAVRRWSRCKETTNTACFYFTGVLTNARARMCTPTVESCERDLAGVRRDADMVVDSRRCSVLRVRTR